MAERPAPAFTLPDVTADEAILAPMLLHGVAAIRRQQLRTGEIPCYRRGQRGSLEYCRSLFVSTFVHDALGALDARGPWYESAAVELLALPYRAWLLREVADIRRRIGAFLAWQEEADGTWRFFGRGSGIDPDSDTTACAAAVLLEQPGPRGTDRWQRHVEALLRFRAATGLFFSYVHDDGTGYSWMDERGRPLLGFDRVVNANVLRYLALVGFEAEAVRAHVVDECLAGQFEAGSPDYPSPLSFFSIVARAWHQAQLADLDRLAQHLTPQIVGRQGPDGAFGGPLSTALALAALLDLGYRGPALAPARTALLNGVDPLGGWGYEDFVIHGFGSPALTTAVALAALVRYRSWLRPHEAAQQHPEW